MNDKAARMAKRIEVLKLVATILKESHPMLARKMVVLSDNPGQQEHFQKLALELLAEAQTDAAMLIHTLSKAAMAMFIEKEAEGATKLLQQQLGIAKFI